jgi:hypothetical protein
MTTIYTSRHVTLPSGYLMPSTRRRLVDLKQQNRQLEHQLSQRRVAYALLGAFFAAVLLLYGAGQQIINDVREHELRSRSLKVCEDYFAAVTSPPTYDPVTCAEQVITVLDTIEAR